MRPARVSVVPGGAMTSMRSKPSAPMRNSVSAQECPLPSWEATRVCPPNQVCPRFMSARSSDRSPVTRASWIAATVRPGMPRSHSGATAGADSKSGACAPSRAASGKGCTMT
ncbi:MAG: hypothetical protein BWX79_03131 [Alphaproteobacteria bacterium ADurb.Bin100]|nr:MAG: hypothetical protein BWX79_03131 [Alphaproteobacteria bacterium ADurb.Bin100]